MPTLDMTGDRFDMVDMEESGLYFPVPLLLPDVLRIDMTNLLLHTKGRTDVDDISSVLRFDAAQHDVWLKHAQLEIRSPSGGEMTIVVFASNSNMNLLNQAGRPVMHSHAWSGSCTGVGYPLGSVWAWPRGEGIVEVFSEDRVLLHFDLDQVLPPGAPGLW